MSNFHPLEVVGCCRETQLQVEENLIIYFSALGLISKDNKCSVLNFTTASNLFPLEVVGSGGETQLQVGLIQI